MKVILNKEKNKVWDTNIILINLIILEIFIKAEDKGKADFNGVMARYMMASGSMERNKGVAYGKDLMEYLMLGSGIQM